MIRQHRLYYLLLTLALMGCTPLSGTSSNIPPSLTPTEAIVVTAFSVETEATHTITATLTPVSGVATMISSEDYNRGCPSENSPRQPSQISYRGVFPGQTKDQVFAVLGTPSEIGNIQVDIWGYNGFSVDFLNEKVSSIYVDQDSSVLIQLKQITLNYGCPNIIFAVDRKEEGTGDYGIVNLTYYDIGVEFTFVGFPISLTDIPISATFFRVSTLEDYLKLTNRTAVNLDAEKPVTWAEAVK